MGKVALMALLVVALVFWLRLKTSAKSAPPQQKATGSEAMVECTHCGVHLPASEAVSGRSSRLYCCDLHRAAALDGPG